MFTRPAPSVLAREQPERKGLRHSEQERSSMKSTMSAIALVLGLSLGVTATSAEAQLSRKRIQENKQAQQPQAGGPQTVKIGSKDIRLSAEIIPAIAALQAAMKDQPAEVPAKLAAAQRLAKTPDEKYAVAHLQLPIANTAKDDAGVIAGLQAMINSGRADQAELVTLQRNLAAKYQAAGRTADAQAALQKLTTLDPNNADVLIASAQALKDANKPAEAVAVLQKAIAASTASGKKPPESWYKQSVALAYDARLPNTMELSRAWVKAYPSAASWKDAIRIYRNMQRPPEPVLVDLLRLARVTGALESGSDYHPYAFQALQELSPLEARAVVEEGASKGHINKADKLYRDILAEANSRSAGQMERLPALARDAMSGSNAKIAMTAGNIYFSNGDYAKAAELYRAALGKSGADKDLANLRLGMALARAGDKAGATAALQAVGGARAGVAQYWLLYLQTQA
jgi:tetratricopeptide (TPR) repeat protein